MKKWALLGIAIVAEVAAALALRAAIDDPGWAVLTAIGYIGAFIALSTLLRTGASVGVVYGVWAAAGVALTAVLGTVLFDEPFTLLIGVGIAVVIAGVALVETGSHAEGPQRTAQREEVAR